MHDGYIFNKLKPVKTLREHEISPQFFVDAALMFDDLIHKFHEFEIDISALLGMRNLSAFVGELYASCLIKTTGETFRKNPHQDGYPDLLLMDDVGKELWQSLGSKLREKLPFSPFRTGGIEVKATCGSVPTPTECARKGLIKPDIGDQRVDFLRGYDWKAHHQDTNNLLGLFWDFIDRKPKIIAAFYSASLSKDDWGKIIQPREVGGRTTSVSVMTRDGVRKMCTSWIFLLNDSRYMCFFETYNRVKIVVE